MKLLSQDKTRLVDGLLLKANKDGIGKNAKGTISVIFRADTLFTESEIVVAAFETYESAIIELGKMTGFFEENPNGIYRFNESL